MWRRLREDFNIPAHVSRKFPAQTCAVRLLRVTPHTYLPTFHLRLHICKTAPVCGASKSLTRFRGNPNLAERKSNRWPYRSQWLSGALHPSRREKGFLDARHWHFLCRLIGIHHHQATFLHHHLIAIVTKALSLHIISTIFSILFDYLDVVLPVPDVDNLIVLGSHLAGKGKNW